jgi:hypothetical protein
LVCFCVVKDETQGLAHATKHCTTELHHQPQTASFYKLKKRWNKLGGTAHACNSSSWDT